MSQALIELRSPVNKDGGGAGVGTGNAFDQLWLGWGHCADSNKASEQMP